MGSRSWLPWLIALACGCIQGVVTLQDQLPLPKGSSAINAQGHILDLHRKSRGKVSRTLPLVKRDADHFLSALTQDGQHVQEIAPDDGATKPAGNNVTNTVSAQEMQSVATSIGVMLLGMAVFTVSLFYAAHFPDPDIQHTTWVTLSEVMSLFCGVLLFQSFKDIMVVQFGETGNHKHAAPDLWSMVVSLLRFMLCFYVVQFQMQKFSKQDIRLKALSLIGANVIAFASIDCFGMIQQVSPFRDDPANAFLGCMVAAFMLICMCISGHFVRRHYMTREDGIVKEHDLNWNEACKELENRVAAVCVGLLLSIVVRMSISGSMPAIWGSPRNKTQGEVTTLFGISLGFAIPVFAMSMVALALDKHRHSLPGVVRAAEVTQLILSMSMGWNLVFCGQWEFWSSTHGKGLSLGDKMTARMCNALLFSYLSFAAIICLDYLADKLAIARSGFQAVSQAFVLCMGFAWQGAFAEATTCLSHRFEDKHTRVYMDALITVCLVGTVLPAWVLYMLPRALAGSEALGGAQQKEVKGERVEEPAGDAAGIGIRESDWTAPRREATPTSNKSEFCPACGTEFEEGASFCQNCGHKRAPSQDSRSEASVDGAKGSGKAGAASGKGRVGGMSRVGASRSRAKPAAATDAKKEALIDNASDKNEVNESF